MSGIPEELFTRRSIRRYRDDAVSEQLILECLSAATWAPSAHNAQPWRFVLIRGEAKTRLAVSMGRAFEEDMCKDGVPAAVRKRRVARSVEMFTTAPALVLGCIDMDVMDAYPDVKRQQAERLLAVQSLSCAIQSFLIAAHSVGLGACWFCAPAFCPDTVVSALDLGTRLEPLALVTVGYPDEAPEPPPRRPLEDIVLWR